MFSRFLFAILLAAAGLDASAQSIGRVLFAAGEVVVTRNGRDQPLATGSEIFAGDVIRTAEESTAQLRFSDEGLFAIRARSRFAIDSYRYTGSDDGVSQAAFRLLQGGFRTLSGLIGKTRRDRYTVASPIATIGIRGTAYTLVICQHDCEDTDGTLAVDGVYGMVFDGRVAVGNDGGVVEFGADEAFFVSDLKSLAQPLLSRPRFMHDRLEARARREQQRQQAMEMRQAQNQQMARDAIGGTRPDRPPLPDARPPLGTLGNPQAPIVVGDLRDSSGNVALVGPGLGAGAAFATSKDSVALVDGGLGTVIELDGTRGFLERFVFNGGNQTGSRQNAAVLDNGKSEGDGGAVWGRWTPGATVQVNGQPGSPSTGVHFFFGNLTPENVFLGSPSGATAVQYAYVGGTRPTDERGNTGTFLSGLLTVDFVQRMVSGNLSYSIDTYTYALPIPSGTQIVVGRGFAGFNVNRTDAGGWTCPSCSIRAGTLDQYSVSGLFLGSRAQGVGVTFATVDLTSGRTAGVAVFRCTGNSCR